MSPPCAQAIAIYHKNKIEFGPAKAANAGGVAVSGLEMAQNSARMAWSSEEVDEKLKGIMKAIFDAAKSVRSLPALGEQGRAGPATHASTP